MPHEIKNAAERKLGFMNYPKVLLDRPKLAGIIGTIAANWGEIDNTLKHIFIIVSFNQRGQDGHHQLSPMATTIYEEIEALGLQTRLNLLKAVIAARMDDDIQAEFADISSELRRRNPERNDVIHAMWNVCSEYPEDLIILRDSKHIRYTEADLSDRLSRAVETRNRLHDFSIKVAYSPMKDDL